MELKQADTLKAMHFDSDTGVTLNLSEHVPAYWTWLRAKCPQIATRHEVPDRPKLNLVAYCY